MTKPLLPALDLNVVVEHGGHRVAVTGSGRRFIATFATVSSLLHFFFASWRLRKFFPESYSFQAEWRGRRFPPSRP